MTVHKLDISLYSEETINNMFFNIREKLKGIKIYGGDKELEIIEEEKVVWVSDYLDNTWNCSAFLSLYPAAKQLLRDKGPYGKRSLYDYFRWPEEKAAIAQAKIDLEDRKINEKKEYIKRVLAEGVTPANFLGVPAGSMFGKIEKELVASSIMRILYRTGNEFRELSLVEYKKERKKDARKDKRKRYCDGIESEYFNEVIPYISPEGAFKINENWYQSKEDIIKETKKYQFELKKKKKTVKNLKSTIQFNEELLLKM